MQPDVRSPRVLIVDDDPAVLRSFARVLRDYAPLQAEDGLKAVQILARTQVDVVLCDLEMPGMGGFDLMRWAKEHCPHPLWVVVTGHGTFDAAKQALKLGAFDFVSKPISASVQLRNVVANALRHQTLVADRARLMRSLADINIRLIEGHRSLEATNTLLHEQQAALDQDLQRAERLLYALLPKVLRPIEGIHVNVAYRPRRSIGGDFYGATMVGEDQLAVFVADAAGHGVSAALLAVLFNQRVCLCNAEACVTTPAATLSCLSRALLDECRASGLFVSVAYAMVDTRDRTARIASAGHPPGFVLRASGVRERVEKTGPALGLVRDASYGEHRVSLAEGDRLLLYTDGLCAGMSKRNRSLEATLDDLACRGLDGAAMTDHIMRATADGACLDDDVTLLLLTARSGVSTFDAGPVAKRPTPSSHSALSVGSSEDTTWVLIRGRATWKDAAVLRDTCIEALDAGREVVVNLASCQMLDSTMLGTLYEVVASDEPHPRVSIQNAGDELLGLFTELAMTRVLSAVTVSGRPAPDAMTDLHPKSDVATQALLLRAHELLAALSASNAAQFQPVVDALRRDAAV